MRTVMREAARTREQAHERAFGNRTGAARIFGLATESASTSAVPRLRVFHIECRVNGVVAPHISRHAETFQTCVHLLSAPRCGQLDDTQRTDPIENA